MNAEVRMLVGQVLGLAAVLCTFATYQVKTQKKMLAMLSLATALFSVHYLLIGASSGLVLNVFAIIRNIIFGNRDKKWFAPRWIPALLSTIIVILGLASWQGWYTLLIVAGLAINTMYLSLPDPQRIRKSILLSSTLILLYDIFVFSIGGAINEAVAITSSVIGIARENKRQQFA